MSKENDEEFRKKLTAQLEELALEMKRKKEASLPVAEQAAKQSPEREIHHEGDKDLLKIAQKWLEIYKAKAPEFKDYDFFFSGQGGSLRYSAKDLQAGEDFARYLAANASPGGLSSDDGKDSIAKFENGLLIDPRTNKEFPPGGFADLVRQLDSGVAYRDISSPPTPLSIRP